MPLRQRIGIIAIGITTAAIVAALGAGPTERYSSSYHDHRTFSSTAAGSCVETTVSGTITGVRTGTAPLAQWSAVTLSNPTMTTAGYKLVSGRCDHNHPISLSADLQQTWSTTTGPAVSRRTQQGPSNAVLQQFNSGSPIKLPDRGTSWPLSSPDYPITGNITIDAHFNSGSESFAYRTHTTLSSTTN